SKALTYARHRTWQYRFYRCRFQARQRGIPFTLTPDQYKAIADLPCVYCGHPEKDTGSGIDRRDSVKGYTATNSVAACGPCNWAKNSYFTYEEMFVIGKAIAEVRRLRELPKVTVS